MTLRELLINCGGSVKYKVYDRQTRQYIDVSRWERSKTTERSIYVINQVKKMLIIVID